jgi:rod shape-determining protein MreD
MRALRPYLLVILGLWLFAALQQAYSSRFTLLGAEPDFLIVFLASFSLLASRYAGATVGFLAGVLQGALAGADLTHFAISRTLGGFLTSWSRDFQLEQTAVAVAGTAFATTLVCRVLFMFLAAPPDIARFLGATIISALMNGLLSVPTHRLLRAIWAPDTDKRTGGLLL